MVRGLNKCHTIRKCYCVIAFRQHVTQIKNLALKLRRSLCVSIDTWSLSFFVWPSSVIYLNFISFNQILQYISFMKESNDFEFPWKQDSMFAEAADQEPYYALYACVKLCVYLSNFRTNPSVGDSHLHHFTAICIHCLCYFCLRLIITLSWLAILNSACRSQGLVWSRKRKIRAKVDS